MINKDFSDELIREGCHLFVSQSKASQEKIFSSLIESSKLKPGAVVYVALDKAYQEVGDGIVNSGAYLILSEETRPPKKDRIFSVKDRRSLVNISIVLDTLTTKKDVSWLFFDAIDRMLALNDVYVLKRFFSYLVKNISYKNISGVFLALDSEQASRLVPYIQDLFDNTTILNG